jgi:hypothetical protein
MLVFLVAFQDCGAKPLNWLTSIGGAIALGPLALCKTTFALASLALLVLADLKWAYSRRLPLLTLAFLSSATLTYLSLGQSLSAIPLFVELQGETVRGYSEAIAVPGSTTELVAFLITSVLLGALIFRTEWAQEGVRPRVEALVLFFGLGVFWLITFKAGFVRQDLHTLITWQAAGFGAIFYAVSRTWPLGLKKAAPSAVLGIGVTLLVIVAPMRWAQLGDPGSYGSTFLDRVGTIYRGLLVNGPIQYWSSVFAFVSHPRTWLAQADADKTQAWAHLRENRPLPQVDGSVDVIPQQAALVIANGLDYRPAPVRQEMAYTPRLIAMNREFFESAHAPDWLFFAPSAMYGRYPSLTEGALWPDFLRLYAPKKLDGDLLLLRRRTEPISDILGSSRRFRARVGEEITITGTRPVFVKIGMKETWLGLIFNLLFRSPEVRMIVKVKGSTETSYRLVPEMASSGFLLSPFVDDARSYLALANGEFSEWRQVERFSVLLGQFSRLAYLNEIEVQFIPLVIPEPIRESHQIMGHRGLE